MNLSETLKQIENRSFIKKLTEVYGSDNISFQNERYKDLLRNFSKYFPDREDIELFSAPGRAEIGGNHTDHQQGAVLAAALNTDIIAAVSFHNEGKVNIVSEDFGSFSVSLCDLKVYEFDNDTVKLIKGIVSEFLKHKVTVCGLDVYCSSQIICGGGLSSSAAFEMLLCCIINAYYGNSRFSPCELAHIGYIAENEYLGKKSGKLDQMISANGGILFADFYDEQNPTVQKFEFDFEKNGLSLIITNTKSSHEKLSDEYGVIRKEMSDVASFFGEKTLSRVNEKQFYEKIPQLRDKFNDRSVLRAVHFFDETKRAFLEKEALCNNDVNTFLKLVNESGDSSYMLLQNLYSYKNPESQPLCMAIMTAKKTLCGKGAVRVHGGGFAGTVLAFVPCELEETYIKNSERIFGKGSTEKYTVRKYGAVNISGVLK